jgi:hypothetical protein
MVYTLDSTYTNKTVQTKNYELQFKYNTHHDYFYYDLYTLKGVEVWLNNKVVAGSAFDGIDFKSTNDYATIDNIDTFSLVTDE